MQLNDTEYKSITWKSLNAGVVIFSSSICISMLHNPLNAYMNAKLSNLPLSKTNIWSGLAAYITATIGRTSYMAGAKHYEYEQTSQITKIPSYKISLYASLGDVIMSQTPEALSQVRKLPAKALEQFNWKTPYNIYKLSTTTLGARFGFAYANYFTLCKVEPLYLKEIKYLDDNYLHLKNETLAFFAAGLASGSTAAIFSFFFSIYRDFRLNEAKIVDGNLTFPSISKTCESLKKYTIETGTKNLLLFQLMPRIIRTSGRFGIFSGVASYLGEEPLDKLISKERFLEPRTK